MSRCLFAALLSLCVPAFGLASVYDDAMYWLRGAVDINGDGKLQSAEIVNSARRKDNATQGCSIAGAYGFDIVAADVVGRFNACTNADWSCVSAPATTDGYLVIYPAKDRETGYQCDTYTVMLRFKWDGTLQADKTVPVLNIAQNWNNKRGWNLGFQYDETKGGFTTTWGAGQRANRDMGSKNTNVVPGFRANEWFDVAVVCKWRGDSTTVQLDMYCCEANGEGTWSVFDWPRPWPGASSLVRVGIQPGDPVFLVPPNFSGAIANYAIWPRELTVDEMREACAAPNPGEALWRVGNVDGKNDEFALTAEGAVGEVPGIGLWDQVPPQLDADCGDFSVRFDYSSYRKGLDLSYAVRVVPTADHAGHSSCISGYLNGKKIRRLNLIGTSAAQFLLPSADMVAGENVFSLHFDGGAVLGLDAIEAVGSWVIGNYNWSLSKTSGCMLDTASVTHYNLWECYPNAMSGGWANDTEDVDSTEAATLRFDVPADMTCHGYRFGISGNQWSASPDAVRTYLNGTLLQEKQRPYQYEVWAVDIPRDTLRAGTNVIQVRRVVNGSWWGGARGYMFQLSDYKRPPSNVGLTVSVR